MPLAHKHEANTLLVIVTDRLSDLIDKGEITERYYNPGELFKNVHILSISSDDNPDLVRLKKTVGGAALYYHSIAPPSLLKTLVWQPCFLSSWAEKVIRLSTQIRPDMIRCHGNRLNAYVAGLICKKLNIPCIISMHINPDADLRYHAKLDLDFRKFLFLSLVKPLERISISSADAVILVYQFIVPYVNRLGSNRTELIYNAVNPSSLEKKENYERNGKLKVLIVGRQFKQKNPSPVLRACAQIHDIELTLIGNGDFHERLKKLANQLHIFNRCVFIPSVQNDELCKMIKDFDVFVSINDYGGISKAELEASHVGLPVITNAHPSESEPEVIGKSCITVNGSVGSYVEALLLLKDDKILRERLGRGVRELVSDITPEKMEMKTVDLYRNILAKHG